MARSDSIAALRARIRDAYLSGQSSPKIGQAVQLHANTVRHHLRRAGVTLRPRGSHGRRYSVDDAAFDVLTPEAEYWIGLLMADGCVYQQQGTQARIWLTLHQKDIQHLRAYRSFLKATNPIHLQGDGTARVCITSAQLAEALAAHGVCPAKSPSARALQLAASRHFWRGVVDGDGCIRRRRDGFASLFLVGSEALMGQFEQFVHANINCSVRAYRYLDSNLSRVVLSGGTAVAMLRVLYVAGDIALQRKVAIARALTNR